VRFTPIAPHPRGSRGRLEALVELVDPRDQLVDALRGVLAALVQLPQPHLALRDLAREPVVLGTERLEALDERLDGSSEATLVVGRLRRRSRARGRLRALGNWLTPEAGWRIEGIRGPTVGSSGNAAKAGAQT
jgi:hypothetical protein